MSIWILIFYIDKLVSTLKTHVQDAQVSRTHWKMQNLPVSCYQLLLAQICFDTINNSVTRCKSQNLFNIWPWINHLLKSKWRHHEWRLHCHMKGPVTAAHTYARRCRAVHWSTNSQSLRNHNPEENSWSLPPNVSLSVSFRQKLNCLLLILGHSFTYHPICDSIRYVDTRWRK